MLTFIKTHVVRPCRQRNECSPQPDDKLVNLTPRKACDIVTYVHIMEAFIDLRKVTVVSYIFIDLHFSLEIILNQSRDLSSALDTTESRAAPYTTCNKLESGYH